MEKSIKLVETTLSNRFDGLTDKVSKLLSKISETKQELSGEVTTDPYSVEQVLSVSTDNIPSKHSNISKVFSSILSEEREKDKRRLNLILHNVQYRSILT